METKSDGERVRYEETRKDGVRGGRKQGIGEGMEGMGERRTTNMKEKEGEENLS